MWPLASRVLQRAARCFGGDTRAAILMKSSRPDINAPEHSFLAGTARGCCPSASDYFGRHSRLFASTIRSRHLVNNSKTCVTSLSPVTALPAWRAAHNARELFPKVDMDSTDRFGDLRFSVGRERAARRPYLPTPRGLGEPFSGAES
jgi:hypothetical protein